MLRPIPILLLSAGLAVAGESEPRPVAQVVAALRKECSNPTTPDKPESMSYVSATEHIRWKLVCELAERKESGIPLVKTARKKAEDDIQTGDRIERVEKDNPPVKPEPAKPEADLRDMLTVSLALMGDKDGVAETAQLLLQSKSPAVRVCSAMALRQLKDKSTLQALKAALHDPYKREDGACCKIDDGMCHPVRIVAQCALVEMGLTLDEVKRIMEEEKKTPQPGIEAATREPRR
jgi:hypothetical protein